MLLVIDTIFTHLQNVFLHSQENLTTYKYIMSYDKVNTNYLQLGHKQTLRPGKTLTCHAHPVLTDESIGYCDFQPHTVPDF